MAKNTMSKGEKPKFARNRFSREDKERKHSEAVARQGIYDSLTAEQKLAALDRCGFAAIKERIKIVQSEISKQVRRSADVTPPMADPADIASLEKQKKGAKARKQSKKDKKAS
jgi:hypothetical protein